MKHKFLFLLLTLFNSIFVFAADPLSYADIQGSTPLADYFPVIVYSDTDAFQNVFQFVSAVAQEFSSGGDLFLVGALGMGVSILFGLYKAFLRYSIGGAALEIIFPAMAALILVAPSQSVYIYDGRTAQSVNVKIVDNVPFFVAATASITSVTTARIMSIVADTSANVGNAGTFDFGAQGLGAPEAFALKALEVAKFESNTTDAIDTAIKECIVPISKDATLIDYIGTYKTNGIYDSFGALYNIAQNNPLLNNITTSDGTNCKTFIEQNFSPGATTAVESKMEQEIKGHLTYFEIENLAALAATTLGMTNDAQFSATSTETLSNLIGYLKNYNFTGATTGALINAREEALGGGNSLAIVNEVTAKATMGNIQTTGMGSWRAMGELVPLAHAFLLSIIYASSILMAFVVLFSGFAKGMGMLKEYFIGLATFESIKIAFVLANNVILFYSQNNAIAMLAGTSNSGNSLTMAHNPASIPYVAQHLEFMANMSGLSGALGLATMLFIPGIVFGGKVASAMGLIGNVGGMVQNKGPQGVAADIGEEKGRYKATHDSKMRNELEKNGIHVGANSDPGAVYSEFQAGIDKAANNMAAASMYKGIDDRYSGVQAQALQAGGALMGAGRQSAGLSAGYIQGMGEAAGATSFAQSQSVYEGAKAAGALNANNTVSSDAYKGMLANATISSAQLVGTGAEASKHSSADIAGLGVSKGSKALGMDMATFGADKEAGILDQNNMLSNAAKAGQRTNSLVAAGALLGAGKTGLSDRALIDSSEANTIDSMVSSAKKGLLTAGLLATDRAGFENETAIEAKKAFRSRIGAAKADIVNDSEDGNYFENSARSSGRSAFKSFEGQMKAVHATSDGVDGTERLANMAGRQSYLQTASTMQDMSMKDASLGVGGFEKAGLLAARKQTDESIGAAKGISHELKTRGDKGFQDAAQSSVQSGLESALGAIRGAKGIDALANQAGVKAQSDSNALRASIDQAGGAAGYIGLNEFGARKGITGQQADRDAFNTEFGAGGFGTFKNTATNTGIKQYAEMKGTSQAVENLHGGRMFETNAQAGTMASTMATFTKIGQSNGIGGFVQAAITDANAQQASLLSAISGAGGAQSYINNAQYDSFIKSRAQSQNRQQDVANKLASDEETDPLTGALRKTATKLTRSGEDRIHNEAMETGLDRLKSANRKATEATKLSNMFEQDKSLDKAATLKSMGITAGDLAAGSKMSDEAFQNIKLYQERKMEKSELIGKDVEGHNKAVTMRTGYSKNQDGSLRADSEIESSTSFRRMEMGENTNVHAKETAESKAKQGAIGAMGSSAITAGEGFSIAAIGAGAIGLGGKMVDGFKKHFAGEGAKARTTGGGYAVKAENGNWYETNEKGEGLIGKDGKPISANGKLQPSSVTAAKSTWEGVNKKFDSFFGGESSSQSSKSSVDGSSHSDSGKNSSGSNNSVNDVSKHNSSPKSDIHNYNTSEKSGQGFKSQLESMKESLSGSSGTVAKYGLKALSFAASAYEAYEGATKAVARHEKGDNVGAGLEVTKSAAVIAGMTTGAEAGATAGAAIGSVFGAVGAVPGAFVGGIIGGTAGALGASTVGQSVINAYDSHIAASQAQHHAAQQQFQASTANSGSFPAMMQSLAGNPINVSMQSSPAQMASAINIADAVGASTRAGESTHHASVSASYIKETSRSMESMLDAMTELLGHFTDASDKGQGKSSSKS